ncbi:MAG: GNAT family N-acetyltransferase [Pseudomonadota bacterium]
MSRHQPTRIIELCSLRAITFADLSAVRELQARAFTKLIAPSLPSDLADRYEQFLLTRPLGDLLEENSASFIGVWIDRTLVATARWEPGPGANLTARIGDVYVDAMFVRMGIGSMVLASVENIAARAGYAEFSVNPANASVPFFKKASYKITARGTHAVTQGLEMPVVYLRKDAVPRALH